MSKPSSLVAIIAGGIAGASETSITYPAEYLKTRRQLPQASAGKLASSSPPSSSLSILRSTIRSQGVAGLYSGSQALIASNAAKSGVRFLSFEGSRDALRPYFHPGSVWLDVLSGLSAGVTESILVVTPGEAVKTRIIHDAASAGGKELASLSLPGVVSRIVRNEGTGALWRGLGPVLCKQGTNSAVRFASFGKLRELARSVLPENQKLGATVLAGGLSGVITTYASMPFDNIKTRMQSMKNPHTTMVKCAISMLRNEGIKVFWRATTPRLVRLTLSSGITFTVFDQVVALIESTKNVDVENVDNAKWKL